MDQIFNELSADGCYADKYAANSGIESLMRLFNMLTECGFNRVLRVVEGFGQLPIAPNYSIVEWATDRSIGANRDLQRLLLTTAGKAPYVEKFISDAEGGCSVEFNYQGQPALGLGLAHLWESSALSLDGLAHFKAPFIDIDFHEICDDSESNSVVSVSSVSSPCHVEATCLLLKQKQKAGITNGELLLEKLPALFPHLNCGSEAARQISALSGGEQFFHEVIRHLSVLNTTMESWTGGAFNPQGLTWSTESESTLNHFSECRQFKCTDGQVRLFSQHTKMLSANQRIHYYPLIDEKIVHIGYVGKHLPTARHKT